MLYQAGSRRNSSPTLEVGVFLLQKIKNSLAKFYFPAISFTTSPAIISPATDGTKATLPGISRRSVHLCSAPGADTICSAAYGHIFDWTCWLFFGVNNFQFFYTSLFQFATHLLLQVDTFWFCKCRLLGSCRIKFVASSHATDYLSSVLLRLHNNLDFCGNSIDCIDNIIIFIKWKIICIFWKEKALVDI